MSWTLYDEFEKKLSTGLIKCTDNFKVAIFLSTSNCATTSLEKFSELTNQFIGTGYDAGGLLVTGTFAQVAGVWTFSLTGTISWEITGAVKYVVLYDDTAPNKYLVGFADLGITEVPEGKSLNINIPSTGVLQITRGA